MKLSETLGSVGTLLGILIGVGGVVWYVAGLDSRVRRLEEQVHVLTVAPSIAEVARAGQREGQGVANPMAEACADIARKAADAKAKANFVEGGQLDLLLDNLGCKPASSK
jgi:hypothetical protein